MIAIVHYSSADIDRWAHNRKPHERERIPEPGERVLFRAHDFEEPVPAVVIEVQDMTEPGDHWSVTGGANYHGPPDPNVWEPVLDQLGNATREWRLKDDPWPWVRVRPVRVIDGEEVLDAPRWTKEARLRGSPGWLHEGSRAHSGHFGE